MSDQGIIDLLDEIGGSVHPTELAYQLRRRGSRINQRTMAALCRAGRVEITPNGYTLTADEIEARKPPPPPPPAVRPVRRPAAERFLRELQDGPDLWLTLAEVSDRLDMSIETARRVGIMLRDLDLVTTRRLNRTGRVGQPRIAYAHTDRLGALLPV